MKKLYNNNKPLFFLFIFSILIYIFYFFTINVNAEELFYYFVNDNLLPINANIVNGNVNKQQSLFYNHNNLPVYPLSNKSFSKITFGSNDDYITLNDVNYYGLKINLNVNDGFQLSLHSNDLTNYNNSTEKNYFFKPNQQYMSSLYIAYKKNDSSEFIKFFDNNNIGIKSCTSYFKESTDGTFKDVYPNYNYCQFVVNSRNYVNYKEFKNSDGSTYVVAELLFYSVYPTLTDGYFHYKNSYNEDTTADSDTIINNSNVVNTTQYLSWVLDIDSNYYNKDIEFYILGQNIRPVNDLLNYDGVSHDDIDLTIWSNLVKESYCNGDDSSPLCSWSDSDDPSTDNNNDSCSTYDVLCWAKYLVLPNIDDIKKSGSDLLNTLDNKLGFITFPIDYTIDLFSRFSKLTDSNDYSFYWNDITIPLISDIPIIKSGSFSFNTILENENIKRMHDVYFIIVDGVFIILFLRLCRKKYHSFMSNRNEVDS